MANPEPEATAPEDDEELDVDLSTSMGGRPLHRSSRRLFPSTHQGATEMATTGDSDGDDNDGDSHGGDGDSDDDNGDDALSRRR
jgi:hypothetical protein